MALFWSREYFIDILEYKDEQMLVEAQCLTTHFLPFWLGQNNGKFHYVLCIDSMDKYCISAWHG